MKLETITVTLRQKFGSIELEVSATCTTDAKTAKGQETAYEELFGVVSENLAGLASESIPSHIVKTDKASAEVSKLENTETIEYTTVSVSMYKGKRNVRFHGGRWSKYGVIAWPEVLEPHSEIFDKLDYGEHPLHGKVTVELYEKDGYEKPRKVIKVMPNVPF